MAVVMCEHPAWTLIEGRWVRAFSPGCVAVAKSEVWSTYGPSPCKPHVVGLGDLPPSVPSSLRQRLAGVGSVVRWRTPDLWEAIATAIIRQVIRADQARLLHRRFRVVYGPVVSSPFGEVHSMPDAATVVGLPVEAFTALGLGFKHRALRAAAAAFLDQGAKWCELAPGRLVEELQSVPRIGPWTAGAAVADFTHDWSLYPHGDLAVRKWAATAAPDVDWPTSERAFAARWQRIAGDQVGPLTLFTLAWGAACHAEPSRSHSGR
jgi:DNA-3-methyladenine glycosylase II